MNLLEKIIELKLRNIGLALLLFSLILTIFIVVIVWLYLPILFRDDFLKFPGSLQTLIIFTVFTLSLISFLLLFERVKWRFSQLYKRNKKLVGIPDIGEWDYQGGLAIKDSQTEKSLEITSSNSGAVIRDYFYKDFEMSFKLKIENGGVGIIFRAKDLENYLMLQIGLLDNNEDKGIKDGEIAITPHIRFLGNFETFNVDNSEPYHKTPLNPDVPHREHEISILVKDLKAVIVIDEYKYIWDIPTQTEPNIIQRPKSESPALPVQKFISQFDDFRDSYGMIGFRAYGLERVIVSDLRIEI